MGCTITVKCRLIASFVEAAHCENLTLNVEENLLHTVQVRGQRTFDKSMDAQSPALKGQAQSSSFRASSPLFAQPALTITPTPSPRFLIFARHTSPLSTAQPAPTRHCLLSRALTVLHAVTPVSDFRPTHTSAAGLDRRRDGALRREPAGGRGGPEDLPRRRQEPRRVRSRRGGLSVGARGLHGRRAGGDGPARGAALRHAGGGGGAQARRSETPPLFYPSTPLPPPPPPLHSTPPR